MNKFLVLRVRGDDEIADLLQLSMAELHRRLLYGGILVDDNQLSDECLNSIHDVGTISGPHLLNPRGKCAG